MAICIYPLNASMNNCKFQLEVGHLRLGHSRAGILTRAVSDKYKLDIQLKAIQLRNFRAKVYKL